MVIKCHFSFGHCYVFVVFFGTVYAAMCLVILALC